MFATVLPTEVRKGQAMFLSCLLSSVVAAGVKAYRTEPAAAAACGNLGRAVVPTGSAAAVDNPSGVFSLSRYAVLI